MQWPTDSLEKTVNDTENYYTEKKVGISLAPDVVDVSDSPEVREQIIDYMPDVVTLGYLLAKERRGDTWGGLLTRALEGYEDGVKKRCFQYIYIWTEQSSIVSWFWMVFVPLLMGLWGWFAWEVFPVTFSAVNSFVMFGQWYAFLFPSELWIPQLVTGVITLPLLISGIWDHRWDLTEGSGFSFRSTTLLVPLSVLMWFVPLSRIISLMIIGFALFVTGTYWFLDRAGFSETSHPMDYLPVFIWIKQDSSGNWQFEKGMWDRHHYNAEVKNADQLRVGRFTTTSELVEREREGKIVSQRVRLQMANPWHSVRPGAFITRPLMGMSIIGIALSLIGLGIVLDIGLYAFDLTHTIFFTTSGMILIIGVRNVSRWPAKLIPESSLSCRNCDDKKELDGAPSMRQRFSEWISIKDRCIRCGLKGSLESENYCHLSTQRLEILWNLVRKDRSQEDIRSRFVVITKLQDPFNAYGFPDFFNDFRDDIEYLYQYITDRVDVSREYTSRFLRAARERGLEVESETLVEIETDPRIQGIIPPKDEIDETTIKQMDESIEQLLERALSDMEDDVKKVKRKHVRRK